MSVDSFIPELWAARLLKHLDNTHVYANLVNRDYEGEIRNYGDTVNINSLGPIKVEEYGKKHRLNEDISEVEDLNTTQVQLLIDKAYYFNFGIEDIDAAQVRTPLMDKAMQRAAYAMADKVDKIVAEEMKAGLYEGRPQRWINTGGNGVSITKENAYEHLVKLKIMMDKGNVPTMGRFIVVPPQFEGVMLLDPKFVGPNSTRSEGALLNGFIGRAAGFDIYVSNNCPKGKSGELLCLASIADSTTFAQQIIKTEAYRPEKKFADAIKGLNVFGVKAIQKEMIFGIEVKFDKELVLPGQEPAGLPS